MAFSFSLDDMTEDLSDLITSRCLVYPHKTQYCPEPEPVSCVEVCEGQTYLPLGLWRDFWTTFPNSGHHKARFVCHKEMYTLETDPKGARDQDVVVAQIYQRLKKTHTAFIAAFPGFGKTSCGNYLASRIGLKTAVLCHINEVQTQWVEEFETHSTAHVQRVKGKTLKAQANVYIMGLRRALKLDREDLAKIGFVIFDEAHIATQTALCQSLLKFQPKYVLGLSATPKRNDGLHQLLALYFGDPRRFVVREEVKDFEVVGVFTPFTPTIKYSFVKGRRVPNWALLSKSLAENPERHQLIVDLVQEHPEEVILVLSDRIIQNEALYALLQEAGENVEIRTDKNQKTWNRECRVLISGKLRCGVGFDFPRLTMLIMASDVKAEQLKQYEGRVRAQNSKVFHLVDNYTTLHSHWAGRDGGCQAWYLARGANVTIRDLRPKEKDEASLLPSRNMLAKNV